MSALLSFAIAIGIIALILAAMVAVSIMKTAQQLVQGGRSTPLKNTRGDEEKQTESIKEFQTLSLAIAGICVVVKAFTGEPVEFLLKAILAIGTAAIATHAYSTFLPNSDLTRRGASFLVVGATFVLLSISWITS
jgi:hypothetical protein